MPSEPVNKSAVAFIDGQNLFHSAREAFGYTFPNFDALALAKTICEGKGWNLLQCRFYTGVPDKTDNARGHHFWTAKMAQMGRQGVHVYSRSLRYRNKRFTLPDGSVHTMLVGEEKGIDIRLALDVIRLAHGQAYDVVLVFSRDQDLSEVADEIRTISREQERWVKIASAFPVSPTTKNQRGIDKTDWIPFDRALYDSCLDPRDYRPKK